MSRMQRIHATYIFSLLFIALLAITPSVVAAQSIPVGMPENARAKTYGGGWECERGFREANGTCATVKVPANAYLTDTSYGRAWECERGFREVSEACAAIKVPSHAYLDSAGDGWKCDRGYRKVEEACVAVKIPANGY
ncbi:MAG: hypothetical protein OEM91_02080, partial [Hyphomicrobiales bacterium]|nr:hypothetical protein [Hyphomicrobiales bacterium]